MDTQIQKRKRGCNVRIDYNSCFDYLDIVSV